MTVSKLVYYSQEDPKWRNVIYSVTGDKTQTIGTSACGPTSAAMAISSLTGQAVLPTTAVIYALSKGYRTINSGTSWAYFGSIAKKYGLSCAQTGSLADVKSALAAGKLVVASMGKGIFTGGGHFILLVGVKTRNGASWIDVYDPNHDNTKYGKDGQIEQGAKDDGKVSAKDSVFIKQAKQYWIFEKERKKEMTTDEKTELKALQAMVKSQADQIAALEKRLNISGKETYASDYTVAVVAAKASGAITTSADKSKLELNIIQMLYNLGLFELAFNKHEATTKKG